MTTIRPWCPSCSEVIDLQPEEITVWLTAANDELSYSFVCPKCQAAVKKTTEQRVAYLLMDVGASWCFLDQIEEIADPQRARSLPIVHEELLDFHLELSKTDLVSKLVEGGTS